MHGKPDVAPPGDDILARGALCAGPHLEAVDDGAGVGEIVAQGMGERLADLIVEAFARGFVLIADLAFRVGQEARGRIMLDKAGERRRLAHFRAPSPGRNRKRDHHHEHDRGPGSEEDHGRHRALHEPGRPHQPHTRYRGESRAREEGCRGTLPIIRPVFSCRSGIRHLDPPLQTCPCDSRARTFPRENLNPGLTLGRKR